MPATKFLNIDGAGDAKTVLIGEPSYSKGQANQWWLRPLFWLIAFVLGAIKLWEGWYTIAEDGLSYIEGGEAYARGDWKNAINAYWAPLYSVV